MIPGSLVFLLFAPEFLLFSLV